MGTATKHTYKKSRITKRLVLMAIMAILIVSVRLFYYTGPIFGNSQDEGLYYEYIASNVIYNIPITFAQYKNINFSNTTNYLFNPTRVFHFYVGLLYPAIFLSKIFGFSAFIPIAYVILTAAFEGIFVFLIIEKIAGIRPAIIGEILYAFLPIDVFFSDHLQPLVPVAMLSAIAIYAFINAEEIFKGRKKKPAVGLCLYAATGFVIGVAYLTNPIGIALLIFLLLTLLTELAVSNNKKRTFESLILMILGFVAAYSIMGTIFFMQAGNYFLFPMVDSAVYRYQLATQQVTYQPVGRFMTLVYTFGSIFAYVPALFDFPMFHLPYFRYFGIYGYVLIFTAAFALIQKARNRYALFFVAMFAFLFLEISAAPTLVWIKNNTLYLNIVPHPSYIPVLLGPPMIVIIALGFESILTSGKVRTKYLVLGVIIAMLVSANADLLRDTSYSRASVFTLNSFLNFVKQHKNATFYAHWLFAGDANILSGYKYKIMPLYNCSYAYLSKLNATYIALGGTESMSITPSIMDSFYKCAYPNMTDRYALVYYVNNPPLFSSYPPLEIYKRQAQ